MNLYDLREMADAEGGEYVLGLKDLGTHAVWMVYGHLPPGERGRELAPGEGHEEIFVLVDGEVSVDAGGETIRPKKWQAFHLKGEDVFYLNNEGNDTAHYVLAGGHPPMRH